MNVFYKNDTVEFITYFDIGMPHKPQIGKVIETFVNDANYYTLRIKKNCGKIVTASARQSKLIL